MGSGVAAVVVLLLLVAACFARPVCNVRSYGAVPDGRKCTQAIQAAIDDCARRGGGLVVLEGGTFVSGSIRLADYIELRIETGAVLLGVNSTDNELDYATRSPNSTNTQLRDAKRALVYAEGAEGVALTGGGTVDGNGHCPQWVGDVAPSERPIAVFFVQTRHSFVSGITLRNSAMWGLVHLESSDVVIRRVHIDSNIHINRDGIDVVDCHDVLIEDSSIRSEDDSVCLKSGSLRGVRNVVVRNVTILGSTVANGLKLGTASMGSFANITFQDVVVSHVDKAAMAVESVDGAVIGDVLFRRIRFDNVGAAVFVVLGKRGNLESPGAVVSVAFEDIEGNQTLRNWGSIVTGSPGDAGALGSIYFSNFSVRCAGGMDSVPRDPAEYGGEYPEVTNWGPLPSFGVYFRHIRGLVLQSFSAVLVPGEQDVRPATVQSDVQ